MLTILVAHHAEAYPFISCYQLVADKAASSRFYCCDTVRLLIVGQGLRNVAVSLTRALDGGLISYPGQGDYWLNFGVAGSAALARGNLAGVGGVTCAESDPAQPFTLQPLSSLIQVDCMSVASIGEHYPERGVMDMELYGVAKCLNQADRLSALRAMKLVSDGPGPANQDRSKVRLRQLIALATPAITAISDTLIFNSKSGF